MTDLASVQLRTVDSPDTAAEFLRWLGERRPVLAIDTETTGLEWWTPHFARLVQFGDAETGWTVSVRDWRGVADMALQRYEGAVVMHNAKFDQHTLEGEFGRIVPWHLLHDTLALHHLENPARAHGLKPASVAAFGPAAAVGEKWLKSEMSKNNWTWATVPEDFEPYGLYAALDTVLTARLFEELHRSVFARGMGSAYEVEMGNIALTYRTERRGMRIDPVYSLALRDAWAAELAGLRTELALHGIENPNSGKQVAKALEWGGWDPEEFTETGLPKLDKEILGGIMRELGVPAEIAAKVQRFRRLTKWTSAYLNTFLGRSDDRWHVHPSINTLAARTGRESITGPPLQTLPRGSEIRHAILPEEGEHLYAVDYDSQELRLFAHFSNETAMIEAFRAGMDPHKLTASMVYGVEQADVTKPQRDTAKNTRYARLYGAGPAKIASTASASTVASGGEIVTEHEIVQFIARLEAEFPGEALFTKQLDHIGRQRLADDGVGYVWTWGGRFMPADPDKLYSLLNYLIQGSAADLLKRKKIALDNAGYGDWIIAPVHDELLFSVPPDAADEMHKVKEIMEEHDAFRVPLTCELSGPFSTWGWKYVKGQG